MAASEWHTITFDRSFTHNNMAVKTPIWAPRCRPAGCMSCWLLSVIGSSGVFEQGGSDPTIRIAGALKTNKQRRRQMFHSRSTPWVRSELCDVCTNLCVCVCVCCGCSFSLFVNLILNFNVMRHAIQKNRGSTHDPRLTAEKWFK